MNKNLLQHINFPEDLRRLSPKDLKQVCQELRTFIIDTMAKNPGHFGASLGVIELTVALHYVYNTPYDRIIWDVGHQAYGHKILTGRKAQFHTNRKWEGICGFPSPKESEYDAFVAGHSSTSISAALGMSVGNRLLGVQDRKVVAVIGDGSMTGGMAFEGLNNASITPNNILIILNDNEISIDAKVGGLSDYLIDISTSKTYNRVRQELLDLFVKFKLVKSKSSNSIAQLNNTIKAALTRQTNIFEGFNIRYFGPVDGHDTEHLVKVLEDLRNIEGPKVLHIKTKKGYGFAPAENDQTVWHAPGVFDPNTGKRLQSSPKNTPPKYQDVFGETILELAQKNPGIYGITPAMSSGCSLNIMMKAMPERAIDVGIAEQHAVTYAAGLAKEGAIPFCNIYSSFMQRAYDQIIHDVALQELPVVFCLDRGGLVGEDGATHHGAYDLAYMRCIPQLTISAPMNEMQLRNLMYTAQTGQHGAFSIRYPRGTGVTTDWRNTMEILPIGKGECLKKGKDIAFISIGPIGNTVTKVLEELQQEGFDCGHYNMIFLKPIDEDILHEVGQNYKQIITLEDGTIVGGLGSAVAEFMLENGYTPRIKRIGIPDRFISHGAVELQHKACKMDKASILETAYELLKQEQK